MQFKKNVAISNLGFIFNPANGDSFTVNSIGLEIINRLKQNESHEKIKQFILETYAIDEQSFETDLADFIHALSKSGLVDTEEKNNSAKEIKS